MRHKLLRQSNRKNAKYLGSEEEKLDDKDMAIISEVVKRTLKTDFLYHYGKLQVQDIGLNPFKTIKSMKRGLRMIYDARMEARHRKKICENWLMQKLIC